MTQERSESTRKFRTVSHTDQNAYILNTMSIHNYALIASSIPSSLLYSPPHIQSLNVEELHQHAQKCIQQRVSNKKAIKDATKSSLSIIPTAATLPNEPLPTPTLIPGTAFERPKKISKAKPKRKPASKASSVSHTIT